MLGEHPIEVVHIESGIDYITMTMDDGGTYTPEWWHMCHMYLDELQKEGNCVKPSTVLGYTGALVGNVFLGSRNDGVICRASGAAARGVYANLYQPFCRVSRLDLQTTVWTAHRSFAIGSEAYTTATAYNKHPSGAVKRKVYEMHGNDGGYTLYVGSRSSDHFLRLYDKNAQSKDERYLNAWRYEVQVQNAPAGALAEILTKTRGTLATAIADTVHRYCRERGVNPVYEAGTQDVVVLSQQIEMTDAARMLKWLSTQVRPTVDRLKAMGYTADVAEMFGLTLDLAESSQAHD